MPTKHSRSRIQGEDGKYYGDENGTDGRIRKTDECELYGEESEADAVGQIHPVAEGEEGEEGEEGTPTATEKSEESGIERV